MLSEPNTLLELLNYIETHAERIYVREPLNGRWGSYALTELPPHRAIHHAFDFLRRGVVPVRVTEDGETSTLPTVNPKD